jgi:hypothetical protein
MGNRHRDCADRTCVLRGKIRKRRSKGVNSKTASGSNESENHNLRRYIGGWVDNIEDDFNALQELFPLAVIRVSSGIKLFQGGLELANVGLMRIYTPSAGQLRAEDIVGLVRFRRCRPPCGD